MTLPDNYTIEHRRIKHARLQVHEDGSVRLFVPMSFSRREIEDILTRKAKWIAAKQAYFKDKTKILLSRNEILLFGCRYHYYHSSQCHGNTVVNHESKTIESANNLLDSNYQEQWMKALAKEYIGDRVHALSCQLSLPYNKLFIRSQRSKWGSCSSKKNISINWRIIKAPPFVIDYVITHELCHTVIMNHSKRFHTMLASLCADHIEAQEWLKAYGSSLFLT